MGANVLLYDPTAARQGAARQAQQALQGLRGKVVGFIDNAKPNFEYLVDDLAAQLLGRYGVSCVIKRKKRSASVAADDAVYEELAQQCDLVIAGSGD